MIKGTAGYTFERNLIQDAGVSLPPLPIWPRPTVYAIPTDIIMLPVPGAYNFKYSRPFLLRNREKPEPAKKKTAATRARNAARFTGDAPSSASLTGAQRQPLRPIGHQLSVMRPTVTAVPCSACLSFDPKPDDPAVDLVEAPQEQGGSAIKSKDNASDRTEYVGLGFAAQLHPATRPRRRSGCAPNPMLLLNRMKLRLASTGRMSQLWLPCSVLVLSVESLPRRDRDDYPSTEQHRCRLDTFGG